MLSRVFDWIGAHRVTGWEIHERARGVQRFIVCAGIVSLDLLAAPRAHDGLPRWFLVAGIAYGLSSLWFARSLRVAKSSHVACMYVFLLVDPFALLGAIALAPTLFAFLVPLILIANTGPGMRYGSRSLNVTLALSTLVVLAMFATGDFWQREPQWSAALVLSLVLSPIFFWMPIRRIHDVRRIEEDRAALSSKNESVRERAAFLSKVSHELRSPLQSVVSTLDVFEMRHVDAARGDAELISRMRRASLLLNTQLRDLLTLAKGEAGRLEMRPEAFEAAELVHAVVEAARPLAQARALDVRVEVPHDPVFVIADASRIDQILTNLVSNSIRYTDAGTVRVVLHPVEPGQRRLRFTVADTGRGIPESELPTLFVPERQGATTARRGEGSGIGLAIVRILVDHLGGAISVSSRLGAGTTFDVEIPADPSAGSTASIESTESLDTAASADRVTGPASRVLVVDDRVDVLDAVAGVIDEIGFACDRAASAGEAADLLASRRYAMAIVDLEMPGTDGFAIAAEIRRSGGANAGIRLVAMTAGDPPLERGGARGRAAFDGWLGKPIDAHALRRAVFGAAPDSRPSQPGLFSETAGPGGAARGADGAAPSAKR